MKKSLLVTGGSRGIGAAISYKAAVEHGYAVAINYLSQKREADALLKRIEEKGGEAITVQGDISKIDEVQNIFKTIEARWGYLTALVNNAGFSGGAHSVQEIDLELYQRVMDINFTGTFLCCREAMRLMNKKASIVNISSQAAQTGGYQLSHYAAAKAAVEAFTKGFSREAAEKGVRVNAVSPGVINTHHTELYDKKRLDRWRASIPLGDLGAPEEVANTVLWLLSEDASYITGAIIPVTGGR
ncbi:SDR family NAD(P)-dependent oxidoreductase [Magnetococcales bacterium HHB-1]